MLYGIVAAAKHPDGSYVIGNGSTMPWHLPGELKWFRQQTLGKPIIMGRKTFEGLPNGPLKGRENIVLTGQKDWSHPGVEVVHDPDEIVRRYGQSKDPAFITGGAEIYRHFMPHTSGLVFTTIHHPFEGSVKFPLTHDELMSQFDETEKYPDSSDGNILWSRSIYTRKAQKSFNTFAKRLPMKKAGPSRFGSASRRGDGWTSDSSVTTDPFTRLIPHIINAVKALKRPGAPVSSVFAKDGSIHISPEMGNWLYDFLMKQQGNRRIQWESPSFDPRRGHQRGFLTGGPSPELLRRHNISQLQEGEEFPIAQGNMSFPYNKYKKPYVLNHSSFPEGDPWQLMAVGGEDGSTQFRMHLPMQSGEDSPEEPLPYQRRENTAFDTKSKISSFIQDLLRTLEFRPKSGLATLSEEQTDQLREYLKGVPKTGGRTVLPFQSKYNPENDSQYIAFPNHPSQKAFPYGGYDSRSYQRSTHGQIILPRTGPAELYDMARDPAAFVHRGPNGQIGVVDWTGGNHLLHRGGMIGNFGGATPNIEIHPDAIANRDHLARHLVANPDSPEGDFSVSHAHTGETINPVPTIRTITPVPRPSQTTNQGRSVPALPPTQRPYASLGDIIGSIRRTGFGPDREIRDTSRIQRSLFPLTYVALRKSTI